MFYDNLECAGTSIFIMYIIFKKSIIHSDFFSLILNFSCSSQTENLFLITS